MNLSTEKKQTHRHGEQTCGCQDGWEKEWNRLGVWGQQMQTITFKVDGEWDPVVQQKEMCPQI